MDTSDIDQLIEHCLDGSLADEIVHPKLGSLSREAFCDQFSRRVAHEFAAGRLSFEVGDAAMNRLYSFALRNAGSVVPPYTWDVYLAFDDGEYIRREDPESVDPAEKYTRPQIIEIVARDNSNSSA